MKLHIFMNLILLGILLNSSCLFARKHLKAKITKITTTIPTSISYEENDDDSGNNRNIKSVMNITVKVGDTVMLKCAIDSKFQNNAGVIWMRKLGNVLTLNKNRITEDQRFDIDYLNQNDQHNYHLTITNVQIYDENEYICETSSTTEDSEFTTIHSLVYLHVTQSPNFIEEKTSQSNIITYEHSNVTLECYASGKPIPKIKWYQINEDKNLNIDLNYESNKLILTNVTHFNQNIYECIASNGIEPSVSKKFTITVLYSPIVRAIKTPVYHTIGQSATLACNVNSYPQSNIVWFKGNHTIAVNTISNTKYEIITYNQINQTITYLKINNLERADFGHAYKCEAFNSVGKMSKSMKIIEVKESTTPKQHHTKLHQEHHKHHSKSTTTVSLTNTDDDDDSINNKINNDLEYDNNNNNNNNLLNNTVNDNKLIEINRKHHYRHGKNNKTSSSLSDYELNNYYYLKNNEQYHVYSHAGLNKHVSLFYLRNNIYLLTIFFILFLQHFFH